MIGFEARAQRLKRMLQKTEAALQGRQQSEHFTMPAIQQIKVPSESVLHDLVEMSSQLKSKITDIYTISQPTLQQIKGLKTKKQNIQRLVDVVTSIVQIKRLSYGLGTTPTELLSNIKNYVQIKDKVLFCDKYLTIIDTQLEKIRQQYKKQFDKAVRQSSSQNLQIYSKILSLIPDKTSSNVRSLQGLVQLYCNEMSKQLSIIQKQLFQIPIEASVIDDKYDYKFFELVNNTLKIFVNKLKIYQQNTRKLYGQQNILQLIVGLIEKILNPLLSQIFKRQVRYFSVNNKQRERKDNKDILKLKHFVSEFGSITNQIQRFIIYLNENSLRQLDSAEKNKLEQAVNFSSLIQMNTSLIENSKELLRLQLNHLFTQCPFVGIILHFNKESKKELQKQNVIEIKSQQQFLDQFSLIFKRGITRACKTINPMIVLSLIDYEAGLLSSDAAFTVFGQLVQKHLNKATIGSVSQLALIITLNCLSELPSSLKKQLQNIKIPPQLNKQQIQTQIAQLKSSNARKVKQQIKKHCIKIVSLPQFSNLLQTDYKQLIVGWNKFHKQTLQIFIEACCQAHANKLLHSIKRKKIDNLSLLAFEKQVRGVINQYEIISSSINVFSKFKTVMTFISILPIIDNSQEVKKFTKDLSQREQEAINQIIAQRKKQ